MTVPTPNAADDGALASQARRAEADRTVNDRITAVRQSTDLTGPNETDARGTATDHTSADGPGLTGAVTNGPIATANVVFTPSGLSGQIDKGTTVLDAARQLGADLDTICGGRGICGRCQVQPSVGDFPKWSIASSSSALSEPGPTETDYHGKRPLAPEHRLGCAARINADIVIDIPPSSQIHRQVIRKALTELDRPILIDPATTIAFVETAEPDLDGPASATELLRAAWTDSGRDGHLTFDPAVLPFLHRTLGHNGATLLIDRSHDVGAAHSGEPDASADAPPRAADAGATPAGAEAEEHRVIGAFGGFIDTFHGIAIDIGSTTIAGHLIDLCTGEVLSSHGLMNPQIRLGEDLMSRVSHVMMHPEGRGELTQLVRSALRELIEELARLGGLASTDTIQSLAIVANPIMGHLVMGLDPTPLGMAPFTAATSDSVHMRAIDLDLDLPMARVYLLPIIAGHVGADTVGAILAHDRSDTGVLVDVGTNAEIVLTVDGQRYAASSPTGPAFEGAQLSCGQRATAGAIERVRIDADTLEPRFKIIGSDLWSDDEGFAADTAHLTISGVCGSGIVEVMAELFLAGVITADGVISGAMADRSPRVRPDGRTFSYVLLDRPEQPLLITQADVRAIQLAKAALRAGIDLLVERAHIEPSTLNYASLAGAFGSHIDPLYAMVLGLVPDMAIEGVASVGNAAGTGAVMALLSIAERRRAEQIARSVIKIETATEPRFQELFVNAMAFPHKNAPTHYLAQYVTLPQASSSDSGTSDRPRRRRRPER